MIDYNRMLQLERMAALELTEEERAETMAQMNAVLSHLDVLRTCPDCPLQEGELSCPLREDAVQPSADRSALLANATWQDDEFFLVPRAVE